MRLSYKERENRYKLDLLEALCRSQHALADLLEHMASQTLEDLESVRVLQRNTEVLIRYQQALGEKITGIRVSRLVRGKPGKVWLSSGVTGSSEHE